MGVMKEISLGFLGRMRGSEGMKLLFTSAMDEREFTTMEATASKTCTYSIPMSLQ